MKMQNTKEKDDAAFAKNLLVFLRDPNNGLPETLVQQLRYIGGARTSGQHPDNVATTIGTLLKTCSASMPHAFHHNAAANCMLPLWLWTSEHNPQQETSFDGYGLYWSQVIKHDNTTELRALVQSLNMAYALREELGAASLNGLIALFQEGPATIFSWALNSSLADTQVLPWSAGVAQLGRLQEYASAIGVQEPIRQGMPNRAMRWSRSIGKSMGNATIKQQHVMLASMLNSELSNVSKLRLARFVNADVWTYEDMKVPIKALLPTSELARWPMLPLGVDASKDISQKLMHEYCPEHAPMMAALLTQEDWGSRAAISAVFQQCSKKKAAPEVFTNVDGLFDCP